MFKGNINFNMIDIFLSSSDFFAQDAATKLIVTIQEIKKLLKENPSRKFEDLSDELKSQLIKLDAHLIYIQEIALVNTLFTRPFITEATEDILRNLTTDELFEIYDAFCENLDIDSYNLQVKEIISMLPPDEN